MHQMSTTPTLSILMDTLRTLLPHWNRAESLMDMIRSGWVTDQQARTLLTALSDALAEEQGKQRKDRSLSIREQVAKMESSEKRDLARIVDRNFPF